MEPACGLVADQVERMGAVAPQPFPGFEPNRVSHCSIANHNSTISGRQLMLVWVFSELTKQIMRGRCSKFVNAICPKGFEVGHIWIGRSCGLID